MYYHAIEIYISLPIYSPQYWCGWFLRVKVNGKLEPEYPGARILRRYISNILVGREVVLTPNYSLFSLLNLYNVKRREKKATTKT